MRKYADLFVVLDVITQRGDSIQINAFVKFNKPYNCDTRLDLERIIIGSIEGVDVSHIVVKYWKRMEMEDDDEGLMQPVAARFGEV